MSGRLPFSLPLSFALFLFLLISNKGLAVLTLCVTLETLVRASGDGSQGEYVMSKEGTSREAHGPPPHAPRQ